MRTTADLLDYILKSRHELVRLYNGEDYPLSAPPASMKDIADAEGRAGFSFPPSYRVFLQVTNGIRDFADEIDLLSTKEIIDDEYADVVHSIREIGWKIGERLLVDGFIIGCRSGYRNVFVIDRTVEPDAQGELPVVYWSDSTLLTAPSYYEFLERWCDVSDRLLADAQSKVRDMSADGKLDRMFPDR